MTKKTLGQVAHEGLMLVTEAVPWEQLPKWPREECEAMAQAVAAVVREQCAQACEAAWHIDGSFTAQEFAAIIRSMK